MKNTITFLVLIIITISCSNESSINKNETSKNEPQKTIIKEELPPLKKCSEDAGRLKECEDGYSLGKKT